ncbi:MAG: hypothetical protein ABIX12_14090 [Rubrivivax sp.]
MRHCGGSFSLRGGYRTLSSAGLPAFSLPADFHANRRCPMGLQLIGRPQGDAALLYAAQAYQNLAGELRARRPGGAD